MKILSKILSNSFIGIIIMSITNMFIFGSFDFHKLDFYFAILAGILSEGIFKFLMNKYAEKQYFYFAIASSVLPQT